MNRLSFPARLGFSFLPSTRVRSYTQPSKLVLEHDKKAESFRDPWPLPHSPEHIKATTQDANKLPLSLPRHGESTDVLRARLVYQTRKRGTLESDLLMSTFAHEWLPKLSEGELREFDKLLDEPDWDVYYWATNKRDPPERWRDSEILSRLRKHALNEGKQIRRMPELLVTEVK